MLENTKLYIRNAFTDAKNAQDASLGLADALLAQSAFEQRDRCNRIFLLFAA